ncbi:hypothetical protein, partial [Blautia obeum]|uniref:hypothetical protein n=1 Tax=Blautia obeum TaxID=40520 RepID=UPI00356A981D
VRSYLFIGNKKCRIYAACGVSQTPNYFGIERSFPNLWFGSIVAFIFISAIVSVYAPSKRIRNMAITETISEW